MFGLIGILALGSIGFWILLAAFTILFWCFLENEKEGWATISMITAFGLLAKLGDFNLITFARTNPGQFVGLIGAYIALGSGYMIVKWWRYCSARTRKYRSLKAEYMEACGMNGNALTDAQRATFHQHNYEAKALYSIPKMRNNKGRLLTWIMYWPWSALWTLISDPIVRVCKEIRDRLGNLLDRISVWTYRNIDN